MGVKFVGFEAVAQGESHKEKDLPCQDAVLHKLYPLGGIAVVADGHGSEKHFRSGIGAEIAVRIVHEGIVDFSVLFKEDMPKGDIAVLNAYMEKQLDQLERFIITKWRQEVIEHYSANPPDEQEASICEKLNLDMADEKNRVRAYGTTLLAAMLQRKCWFALQIGDGGSVRLDPDGNPSLAVPEDESLGFGRTTSLCDSNAKENFRHAFGFDETKGLTVATDGVTDSFIPDAYLEFHKKLYADFCNDPDTAAEGVKKGIVTWSIKGSRDDVSMAGIFATPATDTIVDKAKDLLSSVMDRGANSNLGGNYAG